MSEYIYKNNPALIGVVGCEEDIMCPIIYADGNAMIKPFGVPDLHRCVPFAPAVITSKISWTLAEGYLPCLISEYDSRALHIKIEHLCDIVNYAGVRFEVLFTRMTVTNNGTQCDLFPAVGEEATVIKPYNKSLLPGQTSVGEFAVYSDRLGNSKAIYPASETLTRCGGFDNHYFRIKTYWDARLAGIAKIDVPDKELVNAYKAGFIYTHIIRSGAELWVGANCYAATFSHDSVGIMQGLFTVGDMQHAKEYIEALPLANYVYPDGFWKEPWVYAVYALKTGDIEYLKEKYDHIRESAHRVEEQFDRKKGIMQKSYAIDSYNYWTIDNESAMMGLCAYQWICAKLGKDDESKWADGLYEAILKNTNAAIAETQKKYDIHYIPICPELPNSMTDRADPRDANWASMFLFGRWNWDGYLFSAHQEGILAEAVDDTYAWGIENRREVSDSPYNFGGYPHGFYSSSYNAGYGSAALSGAKYRDMGIKAYQFMIKSSQGCPFGWWEGITRDPAGDSGWLGSEITAGGGSCPHMWGQATATKVLVDSLLALKADGTLIIGRGIPDEWLEDGKEISVSDFLAENGRKAELFIKTEQNKITVTVSEGFRAEVHLPVFLKGVKDTQGYAFDRTTGILSMPAGGSVTVTL